MLLFRDILRAIGRLARPLSSVCERHRYNTLAALGYQFFPVLFFALLPEHPTVVHIGLLLTAATLWWLLPPILEYLADLEHV